MHLRRLALVSFVCLLTVSSFAQQKSKVQLDSSETIFSVITALNACGYDLDLANSDPVRTQVRNWVESRTSNAVSPATAVKAELCAFYKDHQTGDASRDLSQYVSLALNLDSPPDFKFKIKEADMPPDATYVLGFVPLLAKFYSAVELNKIWQRVQPRYEEIAESVNEPLANMILATDVYLKNPISGYLGRDFVIYLEPMAGPGEINARNYGENYYLVTAPSNGKLPLDKVRHTYLHFVLDPLAMKRQNALKRLDPILRDISTAPLEDSYKNDAALLLIESLIRAIEARTLPGGKAADARREKEVAEDMSDGFVLTRYFYESLAKFEQEPTSLKDAFPDWLYFMDVPKLHKIAQETQFSTKARGEVVKAASAPQQLTPLEEAQQKLAHHDLEGAEKLAKPIADAQGADAPSACFILGQVATLNRDKENAINYFELTLRNAKEPRLIAWSHIYLGRIYDVDQERDLAVKHYKAALQAGDDSPQLKAAADRGLKSPYERRASSEQDK